MATFNQKDIQLLFIGAAANITTGRPTTLNDGEIGIFTPGGTRLTEATAATADEFVIMRGRGSNPDQVSGIIKKANIKRAVRKVYSAATERIEYIGYDSSANSINVINDNTYLIHLNLFQGLTSNHGGLYIKHGVYKSDASATQGEIAAGLCGSLIANFSREADRTIKFERVNSDAGVASSGGATTVSYKSKYISIVESAPAAADAGKYNADASTIAVGDYLRIGGTTTSVGVYKVTAIANAGTALCTITLDLPYQGDSASVSAANLEVITAALAAAGDFGLKLTGVALPFVAGKQHYNKVLWNLGLENFGTTTTTVAQNANLGTGTEEQVKELEFFCNGNEGDFIRTPEPYVSTGAVRQLASGNYDLIDLEIEDLRTDSVIPSPVRRVVTLAIPDTAPNYAVTGTADDITDVLEVLVYGSATGTLNVT